MNDIVIDTNIARLFDAPADPKLKPLFVWLKDRGHLAVSQSLLNEYSRHGNRLLAILIRDLIDKKRLNRISNQALKDFLHDKHYKYCCNLEDIPHARTVFLSNRKILISFDINLCKDVNGFKKLNKIKAKAYSVAPTVVLI
jgi:hypothetical protein